jgi:hypothetical protein
VVIEVTAVIQGGVSAEAAGVRTADCIVLGINTIVAEWAASGVESKVSVDIVEAVSRTCRERTAAAAVAMGVVVVIPC